MSQRTFRRFLCAVAAGVCGVFGTLAHGAFYDGGWDPATFRGAFEVSIDEACLLTDGTHPATGLCDLQLVFLDFFDPSGSEWTDPNHTDSIGNQVTIVNHELFSFSANVSNLVLVNDPPFSCEGLHLSFSSTGGVTFCDGSNGNTSATGYFPLVRDKDPSGNPLVIDTDGEPPVPSGVPEPATLALLGIGLVGLAASRRRKLG